MNFMRYKANAHINYIFNIGETMRHVLLTAFLFGFIAACGGASEPTDETATTSDSDTTQGAMATSMCAPRDTPYYVVVLLSEECEVCQEWSENGSLEVFKSTVGSERMDVMTWDFSDAASTAEARACAETYGVSQAFVKHNGLSGYALVIDRETGKVLTQVNPKRLSSGVEQAQAAAAALP